MLREFIGHVLASSCLRSRAASDASHPGQSPGRPEGRHGIRLHAARILRVACFGLPILLLPMVSMGAPPPADSMRTLPQSTPRYRLVLSFPEFDLLHDVTRAGVAKYGGDADFDVKIVNTGNGLAWVVTLPNPHTAELLDYWTAERISQSVTSINFKKGVSDSAGVVLEVAKAVHAKLQDARANPVWDRLTISGVLARADTTWSVRTDSGSVRLDISHLFSPPLALVGHDVVVAGAVRTPNQLDAVRVLERKPNTLELFIMSQCPPAMKTAADLITRVQSGKAEDTPTLEIRYIFYVQRADSAATFTSRQGEDEVREDLVQMVIRDKHPKAFWPYLLLRAKNTSDSWQTLGAKAGLTSQDMDQIAKQIVAERDELIRDEFEYVARTCGVYDGSPDFIWEGNRVQQLSDIPFFADVAPTERCWSTQ